MAKKGTKNPNAGRKKLEDPKDRVTLFVPHSKITGNSDQPMDKKSEEYKEKLSQLVKELYETIEFIRP
ncbi:MAG: hypothetical protein V4549_07660 [Bacteroidota bacterium]